MLSEKKVLDRIHEFYSVSMDNQISPRNDPPDKPGVYYFQPLPGSKFYRPDMYYIAQVYKTIDPRFGLRTEVWYGEFAKTKVNEGLVVTFRSAPYKDPEVVAEMRGTWWGPLPTPVGLK